MWHNKFIGWDKFFNTLEHIQKLSPWLSRQIAKRASEWPFWYSGLSVKEWEDLRACVHLQPSFRTQVDQEVSHGHMMLGAEFALRLVLLRLRQEFPFRYRLMASQVECFHAVDQAVDFRFGLQLDEWERVRLTLARVGRGGAEFVVQAGLADGRLAGSFTFKVTFEAEKLLTA